ncbi:MAG: hypothetical protein ABL921_06585 [Pirellula sp.]
MLRSWIAPFCVASSLMCGATIAQSPTPVAVEKGHDHAQHGPHHGELLEVGREEYHVEIVIDEIKKQFVVYLLDKEVKSYVAIDASFVAMNLLIKAKPMQIKLKAAPQQADQKGFSSCFGGIHPELIDALHDPKAEPKLALKIGNKSYSVKIVHRHDHSGHDHAGHNNAPTTKK